MSKRYWQDRALKAEAEAERLKAEIAELEQRYVDAVEAGDDWAERFIEADKQLAALKKLYTFRT